MLKSFFKSKINIKTKIIPDSLFKFPKAFFSFKSQQQEERTESASETNIIVTEPMDIEGEEGETIMKEEKKVIVDIINSDLLTRKYIVLEGEVDQNEQKEKTPDINKLTSTLSKTFPDWLANRIIQGKGEHFNFDDLPKEIRKLVSFNKNNINKHEKIYSPDSQIQIDSFHKILNKKGFITEKEIEQIENMNRYKFVKKLGYKDPLEAIEAIRLLSQNYYLTKNIIKLQLIMNLDFVRPDHLIKSTLSLPKKFTTSQQICVITSKDLFEVSLNSGASFAVDFEEFKELIEADNIQFNKLLCSEEQYVNLNDMKAELEDLCFEVPNREKGTCLNNVDDLVKTIKNIKNDIVEINAIKCESHFANSEYFNKIIELDVGEVTMKTEDLVENIDAVLKKVSELEPTTIKGKYILSGYLIVGNEGFTIHAESLDVKYNSYFNKEKKEKLEKE